MLSYGHPSMGYRDPLRSFYRTFKTCHLLVMYTVRFLLLLNLCIGFVGGFHRIHSRPYPNRDSPSLDCVSRRKCLGPVSRLRLHPRGGRRAGQCGACTCCDRTKSRGLCRRWEDGRLPLHFFTVVSEIYIQMYIYIYI